MTIKAGMKYQTRNGRMVNIHALAGSEVNGDGDAIPDHGVGVLLPPNGDVGQGEGDRWSLSGAYKNGTLGVPHAFDLVHEAGRIE